MTMFKKIYPHNVQPDGYRETIQKGMSAVRYFSRSMSYGKGSRSEQIERLKKEIDTADVLYLELGVGANTPVFYVLNPIRPKMAKNSRFYPENGYFMKELSRITDSERLRRCA